jgi:hypothetical protein
MRGSELLLRKIDYQAFFRRPASHRPALRDAHAQDTGCVKAINFSQKLQGAPSIPSPGNGAAKPIAVTAPQTSRR